MHHVSQGLHTFDARQRFFGLEVGARMSVLDTGDGLLVHSPIAVDVEQVAALGEPRWVLAPNLFHHLYVGPWVEAGLDAWSCAGLPDKRPDLAFAGVVESGVRPFGDAIELLPMRSFGMTNEVAVLHRPSGTLVVTDLVFHLPPSAPWLTRAAFRCLCGYPGCRTTLLERVAMDREQARAELQTLLDWDWDRLVMAHGTIIEQGGKQALRRAFGWLR